MKPVFPFLLAALLGSISITQCDQTEPADWVDIPDAAFLNALIDAGVDQDGDGRISVEEAETTRSMEIWSSGVSDLKGIEAFINLDSLVLQMNPLHQLDISKNNTLKYLVCIGCELSELDLSRNAALRYLDCSGSLAMDNYLTMLDLSGNPVLEYLCCAENEINSLDLSNNTILKELDCGRNQLESLDVSHNVELTKLLCNNNQLTGLDVSQNTALTTLITCGNRLTALDVSTNTSLMKLGVDNMPTLFQVCVWTIPFPPPGMVVLSGFSPNLYFTTDCQIEETWNHVDPRREESAGNSPADRWQNGRRN